MGEVGQPGQFSYVPGMTVQNAIAVAGGFSRAPIEQCRHHPQDQWRSPYRPRVHFGSGDGRRYDLRPRTSVLGSRPMEDRPLRILHCFRSPIGGIFRHVRDLAREQAAAGCEVGVICDSSTGGEHEERLFQSIMPHLALGLTRMPIDRSVSLRDIPAFWRSYNKSGACGRIYCMVMAPRAARWPGLPHSLAGEQVSRFPPLFAAWRQSALRPDAFVGMAGCFAWSVSGMGDRRHCLRVRIRA